MSNATTSSASSTPTRRAAAPPISEPTARHEIAVEINGETIVAEVESRLLLTDFLRDRVRLTGTHIGCEQGSCGACTVLLDDLPIRSCLMFAAQVDGRVVRTVEGLADADGELSPMQAAFSEHHGLQCGFCTPGFLMTLTSLTERETPVTLNELDHHLDSSFCRCTGYVNIRAAARHALGLADTAADANEDGR